MLFRSEGMIAQDVQSAMQKAGADSFSGLDVEPDGTLGVGQSAFVLPLINAVKELSDKFDALKKEFDDYKASHP